MDLGKPLQKLFGPLFESLCRSSFVARSLRTRGMHCVPDYYGRMAHEMRDLRLQEPFGEVAREVLRAGRTYLYYDRLYTLFESLRNAASLAAREERPFRSAEVGVFRGGGSHFIARTMEALGIAGTHDAVDTFEGHAADDIRSEADGVHTAGKFASTSFEGVRDYLAPFRFVAVYKGRIQDVTSRMHEMYDFLHLDVDIYEPTLFGLGYFGDRMPVGGVIVVDDYGATTCPGATRAVDEFRAARRDFACWPLLSGQALFTRIR